MVAPWRENIIDFMYDPYVYDPAVQIEMCFPGSMRIALFIRQANVERFEYI